ncbi:MAG: hypothetical protein WKG00_13500 [Polyangiaceae bacterium]
MTDPDPEAPAEESSGEGGGEPPQPSPAAQGEAPAPEGSDAAAAATAPGAEEPPPTPPPHATPVRPWFLRPRMVLERVVLPLVILGGAVWFVRFYGGFYPFEHWLFWRYLGYWLSCAVFSVACLSAGYAVVKRWRSSPLPFRETLVLSFATGVVAFYLAMNVLGMFGALRGPTFFLLPLVMIGAGALPLWRYLRRRWAHTRNRPARVTPLIVLAWAFGLLALALVYFSILTPENAQFDAQWKHLALAQQYAHVGGIPRFGEGWTVATNPHLATIVYTWGFLIPGGRLFDQVELAAHLELTCFLWSVAGIPACVRLLVPRAPVAATWAVRFLFPGVLLYDSSLACGADHIAALFAIPVFICLWRALPRLEAGRCALLGVVIAGGSMPKLTAGMMLLPVPAVAIVVACVLRFARARQVAWQGPLAAAGVALLATSPFWLRNWVWYGDPLYPSLHKYLGLRPWNPDAAALFEWGYKDFQFWRPPRTTDGLIETLKATFTFSFVPNDYPRFHGKMPVFGSLFTLCIPLLFLLRGTRRIWALVGMTHLALFIWYWVHHQDRYLQTIVPWMAAVTAATMILVWRANLLGKMALAVLVLAQVGVGADVYFIQTHAMIKSPAKKVADMIALGYQRKFAQRLEVFGSWSAIGAASPKNAHLMLHDNHVHLGLGRRTASDWGGWQFGLSYARLASPRAVWEAYRKIGVTHVVWRELVSKGWDSVGGDLVFFDFATQHTVDRKRAGGHNIGAMPAQPPPDQPGGLVAFFGCGDYYQDGLYQVADMTTPVFGPDRRRFAAPVEKGGEVGAMLAGAYFVVIDPACDTEATGKVGSDFALVGKRKLINADERKKNRKIKRGVVDWQLYVRREGREVNEAEPAPDRVPEDQPDDEEVGP